MNSPAPQEMTDAEKLTALETYASFIDSISKGLRVRVTEDMGRRHVERVGAYLPDGTKLGGVSRTEGAVRAKVTDQVAALRWALRNYPEEIVQAVNPAFLKKLTDYAAKTCAVGEHGVDPITGQELDFITVERGNPYVTVTKTKEGIERMAALANGFTAMLEGPKPAYDADFADRLENGAYDR